MMKTPVLSIVAVADELSKMSRSMDELSQILQPVDTVPQREVDLTASWLEVIQARWVELKRQHGINQYDVPAWSGASQSAMPPLLGQSGRGAPERSPHIERLSVAFGVPVPQIVLARELLKEAMSLPVPEEHVAGVTVWLRALIENAKQKK